MIEMNTVTFTETIPSLNPDTDTVSVGQSLDVAGLTDQGRQRLTNEDSFLIGELKRTMRLVSTSIAAADCETLSAAVQGEVLAVADGIKGGRAGDLASDVALRVIAGYMTNVMEWFVGEGDEDRIRAEFEAGFRRCQRRIAREAERIGLGGRPVGTTLTLAYVVWPRLYVAHVGDSCAFLLRDGQLRRLTSPHTLAQRMIDRHLVSPGDRAVKRFQNVLVNAVGGGTDDMRVEFHAMDLERGDALLLCTDGLLAHVAEDEIQTYLDRAPSSEDCCHQLIDLANKRGGRDNITVVVARTEARRLAVASERRHHLQAVEDDSETTDPRQTAHRPEARKLPVA